MLSMKKIWAEENLFGNDIWKNVYAQFSKKNIPQV